MTGEERLEALIDKAAIARGWTRTKAEAEAWAWLAKEAGVLVRWPEMDFEERWLVEAALEKHATPQRKTKRVKRPKELPLPAHLERALKDSGDFLWDHRNDPTDSVTRGWAVALAAELERIESPGLNFDLREVA